MFVIIPGDKILVFAITDPKSRFHLFNRQHGHCGREMDTFIAIPAKALYEEGVAELRECLQL